MTQNIYTGITVSPARSYHLLKKCVESNNTAMLWGKYGIGKTSIVYQLAHEMEGHFDSCIVINPSQDDVIDFKLPFIDTVNLGNETHTISRFAVSERLPRSGRHLIFVDEINTAQPAMQATLYSLILEGRIGSYRLPPGCVRFAAGNRVEDKCAALPMSAALKDRLGLHMNVVPDEASWISWALKNNLVPQVIAFVRNNPSVLEGHNEDDPCGGCTPRSLEMLSRFVQAGIDQDDKHLVANGTIGQGAGAEFVGFLDIFENQIDIEDIIKNPDSAAVPNNRIDLMYSIASALGSKINEDNIKSIMTYLERMGRRYMIMSMTDAWNRDKKIAKNKTFSTFVSQNFQYFI